jgi:hypothetical protein
VQPEAAASLSRFRFQSRSAKLPGREPGLSEADAMDEMQKLSDAARRQLGFLTRAETAALSHRGILLLDPGSVLVSAYVWLEESVILWPNVILQGSAGGRIEIGRATNLFPGTRIVASGGSVIIGADAQIGEEGGFTIKAGAGETIGLEKALASLVEDRSPSRTGSGAAPRFWARSAAKIALWVMGAPIASLNRTTAAGF